MPHPYSTDTRMQKDYITDSPDIEAIELWNSQCFITENPYHTMLQEALRNSIYDDIGELNATVQSEVAVTAKANLAESELDFLDRDNADIQTLNVFLSDLINTIAADVNQPFWPEDAEAYATIVESWYHVTRNGGYHDAHSHPNCSWCGIYYLDIGDSDFTRRNGLNRFYDPRVNADHYLDAGSQYLNGTGIWDIEPKDGQIVIFPSYLKHSALPYFGDKDRIVIAFNARVDFV
ncbi:putative 2OG-Fe(II) oxygenase [Reinekea sp. G2M2-21]|uniref:putative 2OG-Fe(II) oxygenase n=1 Tax=Reinekea sp. G2M2-21 TaxID=2788942 RepID=UPI001E41A9D9|nr:putative 2OG-Fe(II) oxygenase [Reinekea sp. G2M2-21]